MGMLRNNLKRDYAQIPNKLIEDHSISTGAFRVMCYLFSRPDNWNVFNNQIMKALNIRKTDTLSKYWKELESRGWISREKISSPKIGKVGAFLYTLNEYSTLSPIIGDTPEDGVHQNGDYPKMGEHNNTDLINKTKKSNKEEHLQNYKQFLKALKEKAKYKSKVTETKEGLILFNSITNKQLLFDRYIKHQLKENNYAQRITAFMQDWEVHKNIKIPSVQQNSTIQENHILGI